MPIHVTCSSCLSEFNAPDSGAGKRTKCPKCGGVIEIPAAAPVDEVFEAEEQPARPFDSEFEVEPPPEVPAQEDRKPCPKCGEMIAHEALKCRFCGEIFDPMLRTYQRSIARGEAGGADALFLHIPVGRLVVLSILTLHLYEAYWIYKNWRYLKLRFSLSIWPFWRGIFGIFFCHSLLRHIHDDEEARAVEEPTFSAAGLATGWVVLMIAGNLVSRAPGLIPLVLAAIMPSWACLVPVQKYINSVTERRDPGLRYYRWSWGHIACLAIGLLAWFGNVLALIGENMPQ